VFDHFGDEPVDVLMDKVELVDIRDYHWSELTICGIGYDDQHHPHHLTRATS
jgi:hypothetical protein